MDNNTDYQAAEILAQQDPVAFINSNPTPRDWDMTPEDINRSLRFNPHELIEAATTIETREGPEKHGFLRTLWDQTLNGIVSGMEAVGGQALAYSTAYTSPNMSREEAERILEDALYNDSLYRNALQFERTKHVGNDFAAGLGNAIGSMITLVGVGAVTGSPALVSMVAGVQAAAEMKGQLVDEYVSKFGSTEGYAEESAKDSAIATGYGIFTGITETLLGVEKLATGAINRTTRADAYARLLRQQGKLSASKWVKTGSRLVRSAIEEGAEEFTQSLAETEAASWSTYAKQLSDSQELKQALTATMYGALVGGPVGMGLYRYNRKTVIDRISKWADENKINLTAQQKVQIADDMLDNGRRQMVDEIATRAEIKNKYGQAYNLLKTRIKDLFINSTSKPWERLGQDIDQYVEDVAYTVTLPAVLLANKAHLPLSEFLDVVNLRVIKNKLHFTPIESADQLRAMLKQQETIIRTERRKAGLGIGDEARLKAAQRRKLILQDAIAEMTKADNAEHEARRRSYAQKDYIKAQELLPEQTTTIDQAQEAAENEEYVLFGQKRIPVTYEVVELDSIQPSHINGTPNPNYTNKELQNRASRGTTQDVADLRGKATNITPGRLLTSYTSSEGAPVINAQGEVIAGNGRTEIVRFAYENPETAKQYRDALENAGFSTEGMTRPILVRRNTTMTPEEQVAAADLSNISETSAFDTASRAKRDTQYLPGTTTPLEFAAKLPMSERRGLMMNNGKWNMRAVRQRYEEAVLAWVCGNDARLFEALVLDGKLTQKTISTITANAALLIETETAHPDAGIRQDLYNALVKMQNTTRQNFIEMTQQPTLTGQNPMAENMLVWNFLYTDTQTSQQYLHNYIQTIADNRNAVAQGGGLLGEPIAPLSKKDALMQALQTTDEARRQASLDRGVEYKSIFTEDGQITTPELNAAVLSYKNELTGLTGTAANDQILEQLGFVSGKTFYERPSTLYVLRGGEGQIVHGWGVYLLADQAKNVENYRRKFQRDLVFVRNFPEFMSKNRDNQLNASETVQFEAFVRGFDSPYNTNTMADLLNDELDPTTPEAKFFLKVQLAVDDILERKELVQGQAHIIYHTFRIPRNAHPWLKDFIKRVNATVKERAKTMGDRHLPRVVHEMLKNDRGDDFDAFLRHAIETSPKYHSNSIPFGTKVIRFINERLTSDEYGPIKFDEQIPMPWAGLTVEETQRLMDDLNAIQMSAFANPDIESKYRMFASNNRVFFLHAILEELSVAADMYENDYMKLDKILTDGAIPIERALKDESGLSPFMRRLLQIARDLYSDLAKTQFADDADPVLFLAEALESVLIEDTMKSFLSVAYPDISNPTNPAEEYFAKTNPFRREEIFKMLRTGRLEIDYTTDNVELFKDTVGTAIDETLPRIVRGTAEEIREYFERKNPTHIKEYNLHQIDSKLYGLIGFLHTAYHYDHPIAEMVRNLVAYETAQTLSNIDQDVTYKVVNSESEDKNTYANFVRLLLQDATEIYNANRTGDDKADTINAIIQAVQNMQEKTLQKLQDAVLDTENKAKPTDADLIVGMIQRPDWVKRTRAQQLAVEIPDNDQLLDQDKTLEEQASAPILREFIKDTLRGLTGMFYIADTTYNEFRDMYKLPYETWEDLAEQAGEDLGENKEDSQAVKMFVKIIMRNYTGKDLWYIMAHTIPEMGLTLKSGERIGIEKKDLYDKTQNITKHVMGEHYAIELARDVSMWLNHIGIKGITYHGGTDGRGFVIFSDEAMEVLQRMDDEKPIYYQGGSKIPGGWYDAELDVIVMTKTMNETTFVHEMHHRYLDKIFALYKAAKAGQKTVAPEWIAEIDELFQMLEIDPNQPKLEAHQQEKFARMVEAYITGLGVEDTTNLAFKTFLNWVPERYRSVLDLAYLDKNGQIVNPMLDEQSIKFFNRWFGNPALPSLATAPDAMRMVNPTDADDKIIPSSQKEMNNREKEWGQDSEEQNKADAQLWRAIGENTPGDTRAAMDAEEVRMKEQATKIPDDRELPAKPTMRDRWFKTGQKDARTIAAEKAREYVAKNPEHARELAFTDPELGTVYDAPVDRGMLIRAVMETVQKGSDEWYLLDHNLAIVKSMAGSALSLPGDQSHQAYLDALREVENARELKAAANYAGSTTGALETWTTDIRAFVAKRVAGIMNTQPNSEERKVAIKAFLEEARTKFSANTTGIFEQMDLTPYQTQSSQVFINWAKKQILKQAGVSLNVKEQAELMKASVKAQLAMTEIDSLNPDRAAQAAKDLRHWQFVKDKMKKANYGRWGKFGLFIDNMFGSYAPSAMLMSVNTLFVANIPSTAINTSIVRAAATGINKNVVSKHLQDAEKKRIKQIFKASGVNLAQMAKPTSPSTLHGEKYMNEDQKHWYNFVFEILGRTDNVFRIPTFVDALARIASKNANNNQALVDKKFTEYLQLNNKDEEAQIARKQALAVANMAVFTQDGTLASALNHIRSSLNTLSRGLLGLDPNGFGLGNLLAPFLKTGANVVEMGASAAIAPIRTIAIGLKKAQGKEIPELTKLALRTNWMYFAFTAAAAALLAAITSDDDEWYTEPYQPGFRYDPEKPYDSIKLMGVWVKLDVFGPFAIPMRTAAKIIKNWEEEKLAAIASGYGFGIMEALGDTPLADQLTSNTLEYAARSPDKWAETFAYNQINKFIPAQAKTATKAISRRMGADIRDYTKWAGPTLQRKFHRNYGLDGQALTTNDLIMLLTNRLKIDQGQ